jgi:hypothetical protein
METKWLHCSVSPGQFPDEYAVGGKQYNGKRFSLFAPRELVRLATAEEGKGLLQVEVVDRKDDLVLVRLPEESFENGQYVTVQEAQLQETPPAPRVGA